MTEDQERTNEMNSPVFTDYNPEKLWVVVRKDYEEGSLAMWREYERFATQSEARSALLTVRNNQAAYEDRTGYETLVAFKIVEDTK